VLAGTILAVYGGSVRGPFVADDLSVVTGDSGQPAFGPAGYRLVNLVLHFAAAILVWRITARTLRLAKIDERLSERAETLGWSAALLWAVHPANTECVIYIAARWQLAFGVLALSAVYGAIRYWEATSASRRWGWLVVAVTAGLAADVCSPLAIALPFALILLERTLVAGTFRAAWSRSWPLYSALAGVAILGLVGGSGWSTGGFGGWPAAARHFMHDVRTLVWPWPLAIQYDLARTISAGATIAGAIASMLYLAVTIGLLGRRSMLGLAAGLVVVLLLPAIADPGMPGLAGDAALYLPLAVWTAVLAIGGYQVLWWFSRQFLSLSRDGERWTSRAAIVSCLALLLILGGVSRQRLRAYTSELELWQDTVAHQPHNPLARMKLGVELDRAGRSAEALAQLHEAVRCGDDLPPVHHAYARALEGAARPADAIEQYQRTLELAPGHAAAHNNLGRLLAQAGRLQEAIEHYEQALAGDPGLAEAHSNLGILLSEVGYRHEAIQHLETALALKPDLVAYTNLAVAYSRAGNPGRAIEMARHALPLARAAGDGTLAARLEVAIRQHEADSLEN